MPNKSPESAEYFGTKLVRVIFENKKVIHEQNRYEKLGHPVVLGYDENKN
jgi:hypothetical protein